MIPNSIPFDGDKPASRDRCFVLLNEVDNEVADFALKLKVFDTWDKTVENSADLSEDIDDACEDSVDVNEDIFDKIIANCPSTATSSCTVAFGDNNIVLKAVELTAN